MNVESIRMALRGVLANRMRSALTMLGVLIGVGSVIVLIAVGAGSAAASEARLKALGSNTLTVSAGGLGQGNRGGTQARNIQLTDADLAALGDKTQAPDITAVVPLINAPTQSATYAGASASVGQTIGTTPAYEKIRNASVQAGAFFTQDDVDNHTNVIVIGTTVGNNVLGADANPNLLIGQPLKIGAQSYIVSGVLKPKGSNGFQDQDDIVIMPTTTLRDHIVGDAGTISQAIVQAKNGNATTPAQSEIQSILIARHSGATANSFRVQNQAALLQTQAANNRTFTVLLASVAAISLLVGGIGVMNIMLVSVTERTREIGIRKAIGAPKEAIIGQFITEAVFLSFIGGLLGVAAGIVGSQFRIVGITPVVQPYSVVLALAVAVATGLFFGIYPASRAAALRPIEALRYE